MNKTFILVFAVFISFHFIVPSGVPLIPMEAEAAAEERAFGMREAVKRAMENNHELRAFGNSLLAQGEDIGIAKSYLLPKIYFEERFMRTNNPTYAFMAKLNQQRFDQQDFAIDSLNNPEPVNDFQTSLSIEQPIFVRKAWIGLDMAKTEHAAKNEEYAGKKEEVARKVAEAYLAALTAKEYVAASERGVEDAREHLRVAELRHNAGLGLYSDTLRASTALAEAERGAVSVKKNLAVAKRALGLLLGVEESVGTVGEEPGIPLMGIDYYNGSAASRKDVRSLELRHENAKNSVRFAEAAYLPMVGIGGSYQLNDHRKPAGAEGESWQLVAFIRWDLFDGAKRVHEKNKARYRVSETEEHLKGLKKAVSFKVYEAYLGVEEAKKNAELAKSALKTAEEGKRLVKVRYENSLSPIVDLLDAQASLDHARANAAAGENEYHRSIINLVYESGTLLKDLGIE